MLSWCNLGGDASAPQASQREQAGIIPAIDQAACDQLVQLALRHDVVGDAQARVLPDDWLVQIERLHRRQHASLTEHKTACQQV